MIPTILAKQLERGLVDYIKTTFPMLNEPFNNSLDSLFKDNALMHEPFVGLRLPFKKAEVEEDDFHSIFSSFKLPYQPYLHQMKAWTRLNGENAKSTIIATGTGSGKTECFLYPVLEYCSTHTRRGIKALIIYPMNALATDQAERLAKFISSNEKLRGKVTCGMYIGGETSDVTSRVMGEKQIITNHEVLIQNPPDILLTNYKMLDYLLARPKDAKLWRDNEATTLKYLVVDELHTFDGAQGTDLACLIRRLKNRLGTPRDYLCAVGTSATMGSKDSGIEILKYAKKVFGEDFDSDGVITEERLKTEDFFTLEADCAKVPSSEEIKKLELYLSEDNERDFLSSAISAWFDEVNDVGDFESDEGRVKLSGKLLRHNVFKSITNIMHTKYVQTSYLISELVLDFPELKMLSETEQELALNALLALASFARSVDNTRIVPFVYLNAQLWIRELNRFVGKVSEDKIKYALARDLNNQELKKYLPIINCRDCGMTGWVSLEDDRRENLTLNDYEAFYTRFFGDSSDHICMAFPWAEGKKVPHGMHNMYVCPECLDFHKSDTPQDCPKCKCKKIRCIYPADLKFDKSTKSYECPFCGSDRGLSLVGLRSATAISAELSQIFASDFNDDKKTLAFSDSVQDSAHRAGFFNARTWRFSLRTALQQYVKAVEGDNLNFTEFKKGFAKYWLDKLDRKEFVGFFTPPELVGMKCYEELLKTHELKNENNLLYYINKRLDYSVLLEYGVASNIGRTLLKSGCSGIVFPENDIKKVAEKVLQRSKKFSLDFQNISLEKYQWMVLGYVDILRSKGAILDSVYDSFIQNNSDYLLTNKYNPWMPKTYSHRNLPHFLESDNNYGRRLDGSILFTNKAFHECIWKNSGESFFGEDEFNAISNVIFEELTNIGLLQKSTITREMNIYGLNPEKLAVTSNLQRLKCDCCGDSITVTLGEMWKGSACQRYNCSGHLIADDTPLVDYYGKLFSSNNLTRINAKEHTGLLGRKDREELEKNFKRKDPLPSDPNVLSCTPTLEMGIDIGDLSTVMMCNIPRDVASFTQRAGRAGRRDGNSLTFAVANAKPMELYFYEEPLEMIGGSVTPPDVFLKASAVLERQLVAYCFDRWVSSGISSEAIPYSVGQSLGYVERWNSKKFPCNFIDFVKDRSDMLLNGFFGMFADVWDGEYVKEQLKDFFIDDDDASRMQQNVVTAYRDLNSQLDSLNENIVKLRKRLKELEDRPHDSSYDQTIKDLKNEIDAFRNLRSNLKRKSTFEFLTQEGILPNYAFPEGGVILKAVLYRRDEDEDSNEESALNNSNNRRRGRGFRKEKSYYEYGRSASSALSEFAPANTFYVGGHSLEINRVDLNMSDFEKWRLCPNCSYAELENDMDLHSSCPRCGSPEWRDSAQVQEMVKPQTVYSCMSYNESLIGDDSDDRRNVFYTKDLLVDVDDNKDVQSAFSLKYNSEEGEELPFGYDFINKATLREINFGQVDEKGEQISVNGVKKQRPGFKLCRECGSLLGGRRKHQHTLSCSRVNSNEQNSSDDEKCLFMYREVTTEAIRILIPATDIDSSVVKTESFISAFMLGMQKYFGNVDHLCTAIDKFPEKNSNEIRRQYLIIYDSVPGGTGYLKQLMEKQDSLLDVLTKALEALKTCSCKDTNKDGCYHCLYRNSYRSSIANLSRKSAIKTLKEVLSGRDSLTSIHKLTDISINSQIQSELERLFISKLKNMTGIQLTETLKNGYKIYLLKFLDDPSNPTWEIEPQVDLDRLEGVRVRSRPDFLFRCLKEDRNLKPVAVFVDGFSYHRDRIYDDTVKRMSIIQSGNYYVWSLGWNDVQYGVENKQSEYATEVFNKNQLPKMDYANQQINERELYDIRPDENSSFKLFLNYLKEGEERFKNLAKIYAHALLNEVDSRDQYKFESWHNEVTNIFKNISDEASKFNYGKLFFGSLWPQESKYLKLYSSLTSDKIYRVFAVLNDSNDVALTEKTNIYEPEWNGFWHYFNVMQFLGNFLAVTTKGIEHSNFYQFDTDSLESDSVEIGNVNKENADDELEKEWQELFDNIIPEAIEFAKVVKDLGWEVPEPGYEIFNDRNEVMATIELAWVDKKIGYQVAQQLEDKEKLEKLGWKIYKAGESVE